MTTQKLARQDFCSEFTLQSIEHKVNHYKQLAKEHKTTVAQQSEQYPLEVEVAVFASGSEFANYEFGQCLGYTQKLVSLSSNRKKVEAEIKREIRNWFNLSNRFCIQVNFLETEEEEA